MQMKWVRGFYLKGPLTVLAGVRAAFVLQQSSHAATNHQLSEAFAALAVLDLVAVTVAAVAAMVGSVIGAEREAAAVVTVAATAGIVIVIVMMMFAVFADVWIAKAGEFDAGVAAAACFADPKVVGVVVDVAGAAVVLIVAASDCLQEEEVKLDLLSY